MSAIIYDLAIERLLRRAPARPFTLAPEDERYVLSRLAGLAEAFGIKAVPAAPLDILPARALVRHVVTLEETLVAATPEQRAAMTGLSGVLSLLALACGLENARGRKVG